jgi:hypothetical protein
MLFMSRFTRVSPRRQLLRSSPPRVERVGGRSGLPSGADQPFLRVLPDENDTLRFFGPEPRQGTYVALENAEAVAPAPGSARCVDAAVVNSLVDVAFSSLDWTTHRFVPLPDVAFSCPPVAASTAATTPEPCPRVAPLQQGASNAPSAFDPRRFEQARSALERAAKEFARRLTLPLSGSSSKSSDGSTSGVTRPSSTEAPAEHLARVSLQTLQHTVRTTIGDMSDDVNTKRRALGLPDLPVDSVVSFATAVKALHLNLDFLYCERLKHTMRCVAAAAAQAQGSRRGGGPAAAAAAPASSGGGGGVEQQKQQHQSSEGEQKAPTVGATPAGDPRPAVMFELGDIVQVADEKGDAQRGAVVGCVTSRLPAVVCFAVSVCPCAWPLFQCRFQGQMLWSACAERPSSRLLL